MADINSSLAIQSITEGNSVKVSKDLNANATANPISVELGNGVNPIDVTNNNLNVAISDGTNELSLVVLNSSYGATTTAVPVAGKYEATPTAYTDGDATAFLTDINGRLEVNAAIASGGGTSLVDDAPFTIATSRVTPVGGIYVAAGDVVQDGDTGALRMTVDRILYNQPFDGTNSMPMMDAVGRAGFMSVTDGTETWSIDASGFGQVDIAAQSLTALKISKDANVNAETNPIFVQVVDGAISGIEVLSYNTAASVASAASSNHDYTVTVAKTLKVLRCFGSASGSEKIEIQAGPVAGLVTQAVQFTSQAALNWDLEFNGLLEIPDTSTGTFRVIRTNREGVPQDVYSTMIGTEI